MLLRLPRHRRLSSRCVVIGWRLARDKNDAPSMGWLRCLSRCLTLQCTVAAGEPPTEAENMTNEVIANVRLD